MSYNVALTMVSGNVKTGPIPTSMTSAATCPTACPLAGKNGCYAENGHVAIHWRKVTNGECGLVWEAFCNAVKGIAKNSIWRHNVAGDLPGDKREIDAIALAQLVKANKGRKGFTYTHYNPAIGANDKAIKEANNNGFTVNLSANNLSHADELIKAHCGPVVTLLDISVQGNVKINTPDNNVVVVCPATYSDDVTCASCGLCQIASRKVIVGFPVHGVQKKKAGVIANS